MREWVCRSWREHGRVGKWEREMGLGEDDSDGMEGGKGEGMRERVAKASTEPEAKLSK